MEISSESSLPGLAHSIKFSEFKVIRCVICLSAFSLSEFKRFMIYLSFFHSSFLSFLFYSQSSRLPDLFFCLFPPSFPSSPFPLSLFLFLGERRMLQVNKCLRKKTTMKSYELKTIPQLPQRKPFWNRETTESEVLPRKRVDKQCL